MGEFPNIAAWHELADATLAASPGLGPRLGPTLTAVGMSVGERAELLASLVGRQDPAAALLREVAATAGASTEPPMSPVRPTDAEMDAAITAADAVRELARTSGGQGAELSAAVAVAARVGRDLPPDRAGELALDLLGLCPAQGSAQDRLAALRVFVLNTSDLPSLRMPVARLAQAGIAVETGLPPDHPGVADLLARVPTARLLSGLARAIGDGADPAATIALLERVARLRHWGPDSGALPSASAPRSAPPPPLQYAPPPPSAPPPPPSAPAQETAIPRVADGAGPGGASRSGGGGLGGVVGRIVKRWRSAPPPVSHDGPGGEEAASADHTAYPRIDVSSGTARPDVVVVDREFSVTVGLRKRQDHTLMATGAVTVVQDETIDVVLVFDPDSLTTTAPTRLSLTVTAADPYPSVTVPFVASYINARVPVERRIGVHYVRQGQVVGVAWRTIVAVDDPADVAGAPEIAARERLLLDLSPLLDETPPDLVIGICDADSENGKRLVWTVYPGVDGGVALDGPRSAPMDDTAAGFAKALRFKIQFGNDPDAVYQDLAGAGAVLGRIVPESVRSVIRKVVEDPTRTTAPTILLLTEELQLPWELATFEPPLTSSWAGGAPFLGAHAAIGRWPLSEGDPRPVPRPMVRVVEAAVLSARYDGVTKWGRLDEAEAEAAEVAALFGAVSVPPTIRAVAALFAGTPTAQLVHVALHGQFDTEGTAEGLVLLGVDAAGALTTRATFFSPLAAEGGRRLTEGPFVFLNACQVGADRSVLGDYGGFASTLLRKGATGVVAPLWNVEDDVAAAMAREFYAATWSAAPAERVSVAEAMRRARTGYTAEGVSQRVPGVSPTLIAFQCLAHPQLHLTSA